MTATPTRTPQPSQPERRPLGEAGFTWSEFSLVAILVVLLIAAATWGIGGIREQTRDTRCQSSLRALKLVVGEYEAANSRYPVDNQALLDLGYVDADDISGHRVRLAPGGHEPIYTPHGDCG